VLLSKPLERTPLRRLYCNMQVPSAWDEMVPVQLPRHMFDHIVAVCGHEHELAIFKDGSLNAALTKVRRRRCRRRRCPHLSPPTPSSSMPSLVVIVVVVVARRLPSPVFGSLFIACVIPCLESASLRESVHQA
jgi:hypothetical protein